MRPSQNLEPMSNIDSFWLGMDEPTNLMVITGIMEFEDMIDYSTFRALLEKRLLCYDRFRQRVVWPTTTLGKPFWDEDPNFDIRNHIIRMALPSPRDKATLQRMISDLTVIPLDKTKPLWRVHLIENYGTGGVLFLRLHHAIADGIAMMRLLLSMGETQPNYSFSDSKSKSDDIPYTPVRPSSSAIDPLNLLMRAARSTVNTAVKTTESVYNEAVKTVAYPEHLSQLTKLYGKIGLESTTVLAKLALMPSDSPTSLKGKLGVQKSVCWSDPLPVEHIKEIGKYFRCTINDVLMAAISGALRKYLLERGDDLEGVELRVSIPVNVREMSEKIELGNQFSLVVLSLPVDREDPVRRLRETRKRMRTIKESADAFVGFQVMRLMGYAPTALTKKGVEFFASKFTGVLSNVPGPKEPLYFADKKITGLMFWVPRSGDVALGVSILSYAGNVTIGIATDTRVADDPEKIAEYFNDEFYQFLELAKADVLRRFTVAKQNETQA